MSTPINVPFFYTSLAPNHVRLLSLAYDGGRVVGRMEEYLLSDSIEYAALSYCWGTDDAAESFNCNSKPFAVSPNLYAALEQLSQRCWVDKGWGDAICIYLGSTIELGEQIGMMSHIYSKAKKVFVWLGKAETSAETIRRPGSGIEDEAYRNKEDSDVAMDSI